MSTDIRKYLEPHRLLSLEQRLALVKRRLDNRSHIEVDQAAFRADPDRAVLFICPAQVFKLNDKDESCIVNFEDCLECGTCQVARRYTTWRNPRGGYGVTYNFG